MTCEIETRCKCCEDKLREHEAAIFLLQQQVGLLIEMADERGAAVGKDGQPIAPIVPFGTRLESEVKTGS